ncbi:MAG TPA: hypothetical protein VGH71_06655 [Gammaproteobacteria bacterium]|jgi:hypothetical protein
MKSQVGLGRLYPDGRLDQAQDALKEKNGEGKQDASDPAAAVPSELLSVVVHVERSALNELLEKSSHP